MKEPSDAEQARRALRRSLRKATLYSYGFLLAAILVALGGTAVVAWALSLGTGLPFLITWLVLAVVAFAGGVLLAVFSGRKS